MENKSHEIFSFSSKHFSRSFLISSTLQKPKNLRIKKKLSVRYSLENWFIVLFTTFVLVKSANENQKTSLFVTFLLIILIILIVNNWKIKNKNGLQYILMFVSLNNLIKWLIMTLNFCILRFDFLLGVFPKDAWSSYQHLFLVVVQSLTHLEACNCVYSIFLSH